MARTDLAALVLAAAVAGCSTPFQLVPAAPPAIVVAPIPKTYTCAESKQAASEMAALPAGSVLRTLLDDYGELRDKLRAAIGLAQPAKCPEA